MKSAHLLYEEIALVKKANLEELASEPLFPACLFHQAKAVDPNQWQPIFSHTLGRFIEFSSSAYACQSGFHFYF